LKINIIETGLNHKLGKLGKLGVLTAMLLALIWGLGQEAVLQRLVPLVLHNMGVQQVPAGAVHGSLWGPILIDQLSWRDARQSVRLQQLALDWQPWQLLRGRLQLSELKLGQLEIVTLTSSPATMPQTLALPLGFDLVADKVQCRQLTLSQGQSSSQWRNISFGVRKQQGAWRVEHGQLDAPWGQVKLQASVQQLAPFALLAKVQTGLPKPWPEAEMQIKGDLRQLWLNATVQEPTAKPPGPDLKSPPGLNQNLTLNLAVAPFDPSPLKEFQMEVRHLNLQHFHGAYPATDLNGTVKAQQNHAQWSGQWQVQNALPGSLDQDRLPLHKWVAQITGSGSVLQLQQMHLDLGAAGHWQGKLEWDANLPTHPKLELSTENFNLHGLHSRLLASKISGTVNLTRQLFSTHLAQRDLQFDAQAQFEQGNVQLRQVRLRAGDSQLHLSGQLNTEAGPQAGFSAQGQLSHFNPAQFGRFPQADINSSLKLQGKPGAKWQVAAQWQLGSSQFLQQALSGHGQLQLDAQHLKKLDMELRLGRNSLRAQGDLGGAHDQLQWQANGVDLSAWAWLGSIQARGKLTGGLSQPSLQFELQTQNLRQSSAATAAADGAALRASGRIDWQGVMPNQAASWRVTSNLAFDKLNPAAWGAFPVAALHGQAQLKLSSDKDMSLALHFQPSTVLGLPLNGQVLLDLNAQQIQRADVLLNWGSNRLSLQQAPGANTQPLLVWELDVPKSPLADLPFSGPFSGPFIGRGSLQGNWQSHTLQAGLKVGETQSNWQLAGGWVPDVGWRGQVQSASVAGLWQLTSPASLEWRWPQQQWLLRQANFQFDGGELALEKLDWRAKEWLVQGHARGVPVAWAGALLPGWRTYLGGGLRIGGDWNLAVGEQVSGSLRLARESGDIQPGPEFPKGLGLSTLRADLNVQQNAVQLQMALVGQHLGQAKIDLSTRLSRIAHCWGLLGSSPLQVHASAQLNSIAPLAWLGNQTGWQYSGSLGMQVQGNGSLDAPNLRGSVSGDNLALRWINEGLHLRNGVLRAEWLGRKLQLQDLHFDGVRGQGHVELASNWLATNALDSPTAGKVDDKNQVARLLRLHLALQAQQLPVISRPDRELVVSGQADLDLDAQGLRLKGNLKADRAQIEWIADNTPTLSDDIRILRGKQVQKELATPLRANVQMELDLGPQFKIKGQGLDARIGGHLQWQALERRGPRLVGNIHVAQGSYRAYGQALQIERGDLTFSGAWDNPGLNILALRKKGEKENELEVGVEVRGTALAPQVRLVSTPAMADSEKLAWLVLGHGMEGAQGQELDLLGVASSAVLGEARGNVANRLGLDELGVSYTKGVESTVITLGKRLSSRLYLSFDQGVGSATGLVKLRYTLNPRVSVQVQTGVNNAVDVFYSWRFD
jgi:translocation and assembly module TamB